MFELLGTNVDGLKAKIKERDAVGLSRKDVEEILKIGVAGAHYAVTDNIELNKLFF